MNITRILCPTDFSQCSRQAWLRAVGIAKTQGAAITVLHVVPPVASGDGAGEHQRLLRMLDEFVSIDADGLSIETVIVEAPAAHEEIVAQGDRRRADLIVMGTHGRSGLNRLLLGSVAERVLRTARQSVMTVGLPADGCPTAARDFTRIVCGIDFSECSVRGLEYALTLAKDPAAHVTAVNVLEWMPVGYDPLIGTPDFGGYHCAVEQAAREHLHQIVKGFEATGIGIEEIVVCGRPHRALLALAQQQTADLIVIGAHGRNAIDRLLFGSTAEPVVRHASCAVLTVHTVPALNVSTRETSVACAH